MDPDQLYKKQLVSKLNRDKVKLWEPPYTLESDQPGDIPQAMIIQYTQEMGMSSEKITTMLQELRLHAVQKLRERQLFQQSGKATLKIRSSNLIGVQDVGKSLEIDLSSRGSHLRQAVAELLHQTPDHLKLICRGKVVQDDLTLHEQNVTNGGQILVLCLTINKAEAEKQDHLSSEINKLKHAAHVLSDTVGKDEDIGGMDVQIADQTGRPINLPLHEKKALTLAMSLHEKGKQALKNRVIPLALPLLLEADKEFRECSVDILDHVDNYAVLCLDIVWCYLCLKQVEDLPDAAEKLKTAELFFHKSYGSDLGRLLAVKGTSGEELALFTRLHLLQGIVAFHQDRLEDAKTYLSQAESELKRLEVDEEKLTAVMTLGFTENEARLGLRAYRGDVQGTVAHIMRRREEKKETARKEKEERRQKQLSKSLGKTANGKSVNAAHYEMLVGMGFPKGAAAEALRQSNNDVSLALEVLQQHPEFLSLPDPEPQTDVPVTDDLIAQVTALGFEPEMARRALTTHRGDVQGAISALIDSGGHMPEPDPVPSGSTQSATPNTQDPSSNTDKAAEQKEEDRAAVENLLKDLPEDEEEYLNLTMEEERQYLSQYLALLHSVTRSHI